MKITKLVTLFAAAALIAVGFTGCDFDRDPDSPISGTFTKTKTWKGYDAQGNRMTYYIDSYLKIDKGCSFTIEEGAIVKFGPKGEIEVWNGSLNATGVIFTSWRDPRGRKILAAGDVEPAAGDWKEVYLNGTVGKFEGCEFCYGGHNCNTLVVCHSHGKLRVNDCYFHDNAGSDEVTSSANAALKYYNWEQWDEQTNCVTNCRFENNLWPLSIPAFFNLDDSNRFSNNKYNYIHINDEEIKTAVVWEKQDVPFFYITTTGGSFISIKSGASLTINGGNSFSNPNTLCFVHKGISIANGGTLYVNGYVTFTNSPLSSGVMFDGIKCKKSIKFKKTGSSSTTSVSEVLLTTSTDSKIKVLNFDGTGNFAEDYEYSEYYRRPITNENCFETLDFTN